MLYPNPFSFLTRINPSCGFSFSMLIKITVTPSGICITHSPSASPPHPHSSATMMTLPSSPIHPRLRIYDAIVTGVSFVKRLRIYAIYDSLRSAVLPVRNTRSNNLRLCACVIPTITLDGTEYVVITRRKARVGKSATFSSMWVFPGGHVDVLPANVAERPSLAAVRELKEETGLQAPESSTEFLCSYQAVLPHKKKGYFILFYSVPVQSTHRTASSILSGIATDEVDAACLVPSSFLSNIVPRKITGEDHRNGVLGEFEGVEVRPDGRVGAKTFGAMEIIGDEGEGDGGGGLGMGHRFAAAVFSKCVR